MAVVSAYDHAHPTKYLESALDDLTAYYNINAMCIVVTLYCLKNNDRGKKSVRVQQGCNHPLFSQYF